MAQDETLDPVLLSVLQGRLEQIADEMDATRLTDAAMSSITAVPEAVTIAIHEVEPAGYMRGRQSKIPGPAATPPAQLACDYLDAMEERTIDRAREFLTDEFQMTVPGGHIFTDLEEFVEWSRPRYRSIKKSYDAIDEAFGEHGTIVFCSGTLSGERNCGEKFSGIRFIDRFEFIGEKIRRQQIWNDMAVSP